MPSLHFENALDTHRLALLQALGQAAHAHGTKLWAVGGVVRDTLLGVPVLDIDLTSETPADGLGRTLTSALGGSVGPITPFATVKLTISGQHFDLATTRTETYPQPGTLPSVTLSTLDQDLRRRDFTVNAMAASLAPADFGEVSDPHGGRADLDAGVIRVLHDRSFRDDPTRTFRAVRYAVRLGFHIERTTARWMRRDAPLINRLSGTRVRHEIERMLIDPRGATALMKSHRRGLLGQIHPAFRADAVGRALLSATRRNLRGLELLAALMYSLSTSDVAAVTHRLSLPKRQAILALATVQLREAEPQLSGAAPSAVDLVARNIPQAALSALVAVSESAPVRASLRSYMQRSKFVLRHLDGEALARIGVPSGPPTGQALQTLRSAELDGTVRSRQGATRFIQRWLEER